MLTIDPTNALLSKGAVSMVSLLYIMHWSCTNVRLLVALRNCEISVNNDLYFSDIYEDIYRAGELVVSFHLPPVFLPLPKTDVTWVCNEKCSFLFSLYRKGNFKNSSCVCLCRHRKIVLWLKQILFKLLSPSSSAMGYMIVCTVRVHAIF